MKKFIKIQKRSMFLCLLMIPCAGVLITLLGLEVLDTLSLGLLIAICMIAFILFFWGLVGFFVFRRRIVIARIIEAELLAHWTYETGDWLSWLPFNKTYEKLDLWNGKGYIIVLILTSLLYCLGFLGGAISGVFAVVLIGITSLLAPILNGLIYRRKCKNPEVFLSQYGACVGGCLLKFFNRKNGSFVQEATVEEDRYPHLTLHLRQIGETRRYDHQRRPLFEGAHETERRVLIPKESVEDAKGMCETLSSSFTYKEAMSHRP